jgi:hypothetical protein
MRGLIVIRRLIMAIRHPDGVSLFLSRVLHGVLRGALQA